MRVRNLLAAALIGFAGVVGPVTVAYAQEEPGVEAESTADQEPSHETEECLEILEKGGEPDDCQESPSPILPATNEIIWGGISFFLTLLLLWKIAYPGIKKMMDDRTERIRDNLDEAERTKSEAQRILEDYQRQLADARNESARIIEEARQTAEQMRKDLIERAETEARELRARSQSDVKAAHATALAELRTQVSELAIELAEKVVEKNLDRDTQTALIESYINQVGSRNGAR